MDFDIINHKMELENIQTLLFLKNENIAYLSGFSPSSFSMVLFTEEPILFASKMDLEEANIISKIPVEEFKSFKEIKTLLKKDGIKTVGLECSVSLGTCKNLRGDWKIVISDTVNQLRMIKTPQEVKYIEKAISIAEISIKSLKLQGKEWEVANQINHHMKSNGSQKEAFDTIVASGTRSSLPHAEPSENKVEDNVLIDWGAKWNGYCSDCTRTSVSTEKQEEIREIVLESQKAGINAIAPGVLASEVDKIVRDVIFDYGYGKNFIHSTGHGVGLEVHEEPSLSLKSDSKLEKNMVVTVEPGIYFEGEFGVRIEDMVLVKKNPKILTKLPSKFNFEC
ncbi:MAG: aminopeptidase P family protein [Methanobacteriaceae archaeon]|nr:aminopeptidase P family protein [Methanobacteriaceae archaeon]MDP2837110.1 aminopeptidase P family protein [Methanobacteriaceae archaeon]MDP3485665.1 aminopeptidase P family protein [Methanobacteriaceae archaeon]